MLQSLYAFIISTAQLFTHINTVRVTNVLMLEAVTLITPGFVHMSHFVCHSLIADKTVN